MSPLRRNGLCERLMRYLRWSALNSSPLKRVDDELCRLLSQGHDSLDQFLGDGFWIARVEVIGSQVVIRLMVFEHVIDAHQHGMGHGHEGFFGSPATGYPAEESV